MLRERCVGWGKLGQSGRDASKREQQNSKLIVRHNCEYFSPCVGHSTTGRVTTEILFSVFFSGCGWGFAVVRQGFLHTANGEVPRGGRRKGIRQKIVIHPFWGGNDSTGLETQAQASSDFVPDSVGFNAAGFVLT